MTPAFFTVLARQGDRPALILPGGGALTFAGLAAQADAFVAQLPGDKGLLALEFASEPAAIIAYLAALRAGHAVLAMPPDAPELLAGAEARFRPDWVYARVGGEWVLRPGRVPGGRVHPDLALVLLTSGSTGAGKAVRISAAALAANAAQIATGLALQAEDRAALVLPLHYSYGLSVLNSQLAVGGSVWLHPGSVQRHGFGPAMASAGCTIFAGVPHSYRLLEGVADLPPLRMMTVAGGRMEPEAVTRWARHQAKAGGQFVVMYGQTEATARMAILPPDLVLDHPDAVGRAVPGGTLRLRDDNGREITAPGLTGRLIYQGPNVMMGYAFDRADLARGAELAELDTDDLAERDAAGLFRIKGRAGRFSKIGGVRLGHDALEAALTSHGLSAAVFGDDRQVTVVHEPVPAGLSDAELQALVLRLAGLGRSHLTCRAVSALPRLPSGKVDYAALRQAPGVAPKGLGQAMRDCFYPHPVGPRDSFERLGGDSLRHVEMTLVLERSLGHVPEGWERLTLAELEALQTPTTSRPRGGRVRVGMEAVIRALAILAVVVQHQTDWPVWGGAAAMIILMGWSLARFQLPALVAADWGRVFRPLLRVLVPYYLVVGVYALVYGQVPWVSVLLLGTFGVTEQETHQMLPYLYWFVEVWVQMIGVIALAFAVPPVRRFAGRNPFGFGLIFLVAAVALRIWGLALWNVGARQLFTLPWVFWLCALGWCIAMARGRQHWLVLGLIALLMPGAAILGGNWYGGWIKHGGLAVAAVLLLYVPALRLPGPLVRAIVTVAQATFFIYLTHRWVPEGLMPLFLPGLTGPLADLVAILGGIGLGIALAAGQRALLRGRVRLASLTARRHSPPVSL